MAIKRRNQLAGAWALALLSACGGAGDDAGQAAGTEPMAEAQAVVVPLPPPLAVAAYPGAQGAGSATPGGRGGAVVKVTTLADAGPGSLRHCAQELSGPRTCVFAVGGVIRLQTPLWITHPYLTVAGQTAPGGGILLTNADGAVLSSLVGLFTHDVIWQYTRLRNQWRAACHDANSSECGGLFAIFGGSDIVAAHNSLSWNQDEGFGVWNGDNAPINRVTLASNLIAEGLATHSTGVIVGASSNTMSEQVADVDLWRNLVMNNNHRNPLMQNLSGRIVNNLFYNQRYYVHQFGGGGRFDVIGNHYQRGPMTAFAGQHEIQAFDTDANGVDAAGRNVGSVVGAPSLHVAGNHGWNAGPADEQWPLVWRVLTQNGGERAGSAAPPQWQRASALAPVGRAITAAPVGRITGAAGLVVPVVGAARRLDCAGRWVPNRDAVDTRLIAQYLGNTGPSELPADEHAAGGLPTMAQGTPCTDSDDDGLPDTWERAMFGNLQQAPAGDADGDGYSNLEAYLYGLRRLCRPLAPGAGVLPPAQCVTWCPQCR